MGRETKMEAAKKKRGMRGPTKKKEKGGKPGDAKKEGERKNKDRERGRSNVNGSTRIMVTEKGVVGWWSFRWLRCGGCRGAVVEMGQFKGGFWDDSKTVVVI
ncbi:hypothetical protein RJT34_08833 [Clitoria ternatea]|uniref:Uncharacterized protein n=1 Tax=Clitoria ternatea TaxID=43366 RepID=A0AAN9PUV1_CLITE